MSRGRNMSQCSNVGEQKDLEVRIDWKDVGMAGERQIRDLWEHRNVARVKDGHTFKLAPPRQRNVSRAVTSLLFIARLFFYLAGGLVSAVFHFLPGGFCGLGRSLSSMFGRVSGSFARVFDVLPGFLHVIFSGLGEHQGRGRK